VEISCTVNEDDLVCSPWPYVDTVIDDTEMTALSLIIVTSLSNSGEVTYPLDQSVKFFTNPKVSSWSPTGSLLQNVDTVITVQGSNFIDENEMRCLWY